MADTLAEIVAYHESRKEFDWKDVAGWKYIEHVGTLLAEVQRLHDALEKHGCHMSDCQGDMHNPYGCTCGLQAALGEDE